jgi:ABC-2 type transport system permease protein
VIRTFAYLAWRSGSNRLARQLQRLRSPRYLAALVLGVAYLWLMLGQRQPRRSPLAEGSADWLVLLGAVGVAGAVLWGWVFGVERRVLSFTPAEVTFLFSGPVTRRELVQYKLLRNQLLILFNSLLWTMIFARERFGASPWLRALSIWVLLTTISFHRLGASFVRTSLLEHGRIGFRHRAVSLSVLAAAMLMAAVGIQAALPALTAGWHTGLASFLRALEASADRPLPHALLAPFRALVQPLAARSPHDWLQAIGPALLLLVAHYVWVIRSDSAFEEAAAEASLRRTRLRSARGGAAAPVVVHRRIPRVLQLAPVGWRGGAILWKNLLAVARMRRTRTAAAAFLAAAGTAALLSLKADRSVAEIVGWLTATWAALALVLGPQWIRNDLRGDLARLDLLRSYPLTGRTVVASEAAASALVVSGLQLGLLVIAYLAFLGDTTMEPDLHTRTALLLVCVVCLPGINYLGMLIQNGAALMFPAWVHLGPGRPGGVEALGQNMLMIIAYCAALAVLLAAPALVAGLLFELLRDRLGWWAAAPAAVTLLGGTGVVAAIVLRWLGRVFEATDPAEAGIAS